MPPPSWGDRDPRPRASHGLGCGCSPSSAGPQDVGGSRCHLQLKRPCVAQGFPGHRLPAARSSLGRTVGDGRCSGGGTALTYPCFPSALESTLASQASALPATAVGGSAEEDPEAALSLELSEKGI